jgi:hypothetical protein
MFNLSKNLLQITDYIHNETKLHMQPLVCTTNRMVIMPNSRLQVDGYAMLIMQTLRSVADNADREMACCWCMSTNE